MSDRNGPDTGANQQISINVPSDFAIAERLIRIEVKLDNIGGTIGDHETRIRNIERWKFSLPISIVTAALGAVAALYGALGK